MTDPDEWDETSGRAYRAFEETIAADWPEIEEQMTAERPKPVRLLCPSGHQVLDVVVAGDHNWHPYLSPAKPGGARIVASHAGPRGAARNEVCMEVGCPNVAPCPNHPGANTANRTFGPRVRLACSHRRCSYDGVFSQVTLLKVYAAAVRHGRREERLRT